jgi:hypothetical protein
MAEHPIKLAYEARQLVPLYLFETNKLKKKDNPIVTTPTLCQAMIHLGKSDYPLTKARRAAIDLAYDRKHKKTYMKPVEDWKRFLGLIETWEGLLSFLENVSIFLKAGAETEKEKGMRLFEHREDKTLSSGEIAQRARPLASEQIKGDVVKNKLKKMGAHVTAARDKWEALAALARFYPRSGIPKGYVDALVEHLEEIDLRSFKQLVAQSLVFYDADQIRTGGK